jgi:hypothetical protein
MVLPHSGLAQVVSIIAPSLSIVAYLLPTRWPVTIGDQVGGNEDVGTCYSNFLLQSWLYICEILAHARTLVILSTSDDESDVNTA